MNEGIDQRDPLIGEALAGERGRQQEQIELIASENIVSRAVLDALGHTVTNKTLEGYPGARYHAGGRYVDVIEQAAIERACELFDCAYANVQPHSGSQANLAVFFALVRPGDRVLSLDLAAGGHLSHGLRSNLSGRWFEAHHYGVSRETGMIDYDDVEAKALEVQPRILIAGGSGGPYRAGHRLSLARKSSINAFSEASFLPARYRSIASTKSGANSTPPRVVGCPPWAIAVARACL